MDARWNYMRAKTNEISGGVVCLLLKSMEPMATLPRSSSPCLLINMPNVNGAWAEGQQWPSSDWFSVLLHYSAPLEPPHNPTKMCLSLRPAHYLHSELHSVSCLSLTYFNLALSHSIPVWFTLTLSPAICHPPTSPPLQKKKEKKICVAIMGTSQASSCLLTQKSYQAEWF